MLFVPTQYLSTAGRLPALAVGVLLGMLLRDPAALSWLTRRCDLLPGEPSPPLCASFSAAPGEGTFARIWD